MHNGLDKLKIGAGGADDDDDEGCTTPGAKALKKCKVAEAEESDHKLLSALW
jgi:hypothetical protein